jgi:hypothetical protein
LTGAQLTKETLTAWERYVQRVQSNMANRLNAKAPYLWINESAERREKVRQGKVLAEPVSRNGEQEVPEADIHDWMGAAFIPNATLDDVLGVVRDYDRYKEFYKPVVADAKCLDRGPEESRFTMVWVKKVLFVTAAIESEYSATYSRVSDKRWYTVSNTTRVQEIDRFGKSDQHKLSPGEGRGYLWRLYTVARYEERDGGVYVEMESVGLTKTVPSYIRWIAERLSDGLVTSLTQTRDAVRSMEGRAVRLPDVHASVASLGGR